MFSGLNLYEQQQIIWQKCKDLAMKLTGVFSPLKTEKVQVKKSGESLLAKTGNASRTDSAAQPADRVVLSPGSLEVQKIRDILAQTPDVRADRVQALKEEIARGEYQIDSYRLADKMMASLLSEALAE